MSKTKQLSTKFYSTPLPAVRADWVLKIKKVPSLIDRVQLIHELLIDDPKYLSYISATFNEEAVEGKIVDDSIFAAIMIREQAAMEKDDVVARAQTAAIRTALNYVLRRFGVSRKQRRNMVEGEGGEVLPFTAPTATHETEE